MHYSVVAAAPFSLFFSVIFTDKKPDKGWEETVFQLQLIPIPITLSNGKRREKGRS